MKFMLLIYGNDDVWGSIPPDDFAEIVKEVDAGHVRLRESGELVGAYGVADQVLAKQVHLQNGTPVVTDGPYIETKEYLGSFEIIDCESLDRALEIAAAYPFARVGQVEVRPIMHESDAGE